MNPEPLLVILNEGTRGHMGQSRGIRDCIARAVPIRSIELEVPRLRGFERFKYIKYQARKLPRAAKKFLKKWLISAGGKHLIEQVSSARCENQLVLFLSAGSSAAPYCLALARFFDGKSCVVMTPSVLGIKPFDMAIVPEHDSSRGDNVLVTLGAPNAIDRNTLAEQSEQLLNDYPASRRKAWGILIGGDDSNYTISGLWVDKVFPSLIAAAEAENADLYVTTSRRTSAECENRIACHCKKTSNVRMLLLASRDPRNPVPGILGHCSEVFCTEDSVSMISESVTGGVNVGVITVGHRHGFKRLMQEITEYLVDARILSRECLWGVPRFTRMVEDFENRHLLMRLHPRTLDADMENFLNHNFTENGNFNEAARAAEWIVGRWLG